jgi:uncharacterized protein YutE (UPF0331/DUF86 family)
MPNEVLQQKLDSIARCIQRLDLKKPKSLEDLVTDVDLQDIIIINLERLVQTSVDVTNVLLSEKKLLPLPTTMADSFICLHKHNIISAELANNLAKAVGFRNICVHEYDKINWAIVFKILESSLNDYRLFAKIINDFA